MLYFCIRYVQAISNVASLSTAPNKAPKRRILKKTMARLGSALIDHAEENENAKKTNPTTALVVNVAIDAGMKFKDLKSLGVRVKRHNYTRRCADKMKGVMSAPAKRGRPPGTGIPPKQVKEAFMPFTKPSCRFLASGEQLNTLMGSIRKNWVRQHSVQDICSYRTACRHLRGAKLQISVGKKATDICDICKTWDTQVSPQVAATFHEVVETIEKSSNLFRRLEGEGRRQRGLVAP